MENKNYTIVTHKRADGSYFFDIEHKELVYSGFKVHHGVQCVHKGGTSKHAEILEICGEISDLFVKLEKLNQK